MGDDAQLSEETAPIFLGTNSFYPPVSSLEKPWAFSHLVQLKKPELWEAADRRKWLGHWGQTIPALPLTL